MSIDQLKCDIIARVDAETPALCDVSHTLHRRPELAFKEFEGCKTLTTYLQSKNFQVKSGIAGLETAFEAVYGEGSPDIAILAEYDALPDLGHACGHNIIGAAAAGAGVAAQLAVDTFGGRIRVIGTPGEEGGGGKIDMAAKGIFDPLDAVLMVHPGRRNVGMPRILAAVMLKVAYFGREAHASAAPEEGINALDALLTAFSTINALRQHIKDSARIHGVITDGGQVPNVVPAHSAASFIVRAGTNDYLEVLKDKVLDCFKAGATATGARLEYEWAEKQYAAMQANQPLVELFCRNMGTLGRSYCLGDPDERFGSTDMGNVSLAAPAMHPTVSVTDGREEVHTQQFCQAAAAPEGDRALTDSAKAMAMTVADLLGDADCLKAVREAFNNGQ